MRKFELLVVCENKAEAEKKVAELKEEKKFAFTMTPSDDTGKVNVMVEVFD